MRLGAIVYEDSQCSSLFDEYAFESGLLRSRILLVFVLFVGNFRGGGCGSHSTVICAEKLGMRKMELVQGVFKEKDRKRSQHPR